MLFQLWPAGWQQTLVSKGLNCLSSYLNEDGSDDEEEVGEHKDVTTCDSQVTVWNQYKWYCSLRWGLSVTIKMVFGDIGEAQLMLRILSPLNEGWLADNELTHSLHVCRLYLHSYHITVKWIFVGISWKVLFRHDTWMATILFFFDKEGAEWKCIYNKYWQTDAL